MDHTFLISDELLSILNLLVAGEGCLLVLLLLTMPKGRKLPNYLLSAFVSVVSVGVLIWYLFYENILNPNSPYYLLLGLLLLQGPFFYLYVRALISPGFWLRLRHLVHAIPCLLALIFYGWIYWADKGISRQQFLEGLAGTVLAWNEVIEISVFIFYLLPCLLLLYRHENTIRSGYSNIEKLTLSWLSRIILLVLAIQVLFWLAKFSTAFFEVYLRVGWVRRAGEALLIALIAVSILRHRILFSEDVGQPPEPKPVKEEPAPKYQGSSLSESQAHALWEKLTHYMGQAQPYLDGELKLAQLGEMLGATPHDLSRVINSYSGQNFYDYVSGYRARKARELMEAPASDNVSLLDIGLSAGFGSKNTFYRYFKKHFSVTPAAYRKAHQQDR